MSSPFHWNAADRKRLNVKWTPELTPPIALTTSVSVGMCRASPRRMRNLGLYDVTKRFSRIRGERLALAAVCVSVACSNRQTLSPPDPVTASSSPPRACSGSTRYRYDVSALALTVGHHYVYLAGKAVDWAMAERLAEEEADSVTSKKGLVAVLERFLDNLYDAHATLRANTTASSRLVPSGLDVWAEWRKSDAVVTAVRAGYSAEKAGVYPGMRVLAINNVPIERAAEFRLGAAIRHPVPAPALDWALLSALAGRRDVPRMLRVRDSSGVRDLAIDRPGDHVMDAAAQETRVEFRQLTDRPDATKRADYYGYIRLNALGDTLSITEFDSALSALRSTSGLIIDLRNTPGGGSTNVAEPILGRLITRTEAYQRVAPPGSTAYLRTVAPRGPWPYTAPIVVLVGRWTGSMGEGMAIGLDGMQRGTVVGTRMAGLAGSVEDFVLPCSGIGVALPTEQLLHINGTPRERWVPPVLIDLVAERSQRAPMVASSPNVSIPNPSDLVFERGLRVLRKSLRP
jgi:C-terminal processing protease CtpA/Prc